MSCSNSELHNLTQDYLNYRQLDVQDVYEFQSEVLLVKDLKLRPNFFLKKSVILARFDKNIRCKFEKYLIFQTF